MGAREGTGKTLPFLLKFFKHYNMDKIKIFYGSWDEQEDIKESQKEINKWFEKNPDIRVKNMLHNYRDEEYILTIHYSADSDDLLS